MRTYLLFFTVMFFVSVAAFARDGKISGKAKDAEGNALQGANVILLDADSNRLVKGEITNADGQFVLAEILDGAYMVKISLLGYETYQSGKQVVTSNNTDLGDVLMKRKAGTLKEVSVKGQKPLIEIKADKLVVNVENSIVNAGSSVLEVLSRSPGVRVDQNDNVSLKGRQGVLILIDGKRTAVAGSDLANVLKSMSSSTVDQIEIITNPSAMYDAAGTAGIINIKTKRDKRMGLNGSVNSFYAQGVYAKAGGGFNLNYRNKKWTITTGYNYAYRKGFNHLTLYRSFFANDTFQNAYDQDNNTIFNVYSHSGNLSVDYALSKRTVVGVMASTSPTNFDINRKSYAKVIASDRSLQSYFVTDNKADNSLDNYSANLNLRHSFDSTGKDLSVDVDYSHYHSKRPQDYVTRYLDVRGDDYRPKYFLSGDLDGKTTIRSAKADYVHPLKNGLRLETGIKSSYVTQDINAQFFDYSSGAYIFDSNKSNHFIYNENINAVYINANKDWEKWGTQIGLRGEQTIAKGEQKVYGQTFTRNYAQLFPSFAVQRHIDKQNDLGLTMSRRITRPNYEQLNPFKNFLDPSTYASGYPYLQPELVYNVELSHTFKQKFVTSFLYSYYDRPITEVIQPSDDTNQKRVTVQTTKNLTSQSYYALSGTYQFQFFKWWMNSSHFNCYYTKFRGDIANSILNSDRVTADFNITNSFILPKDWSAELSMFYQTKQLYGYMTIDPLWSLNAGIQKNLFNKIATLKLSVTDIFWRSYPRAVSVYTDYTERFKAQRETRQLQLTFNYRFGKKTVAPIRRRTGGAEDEKRRANANS